MGEASKSLKMDQTYDRMTSQDKWKPKWCACIFVLLLITIFIGTLTYPKLQQVSYVYNTPHTSPGHSAINTAPRPETVKSTAINPPSFNNSTNSQFLDIRPGKIYIETKGRLGNILFQYAVVYGVGRATNRDSVVYSDSDLRSTFPGLTTKVIKSSQATRSQFYLLPEVKEKESGVFAPTIVSRLIRGDVRICCYLQSYKYFWHVKQELLDQLRFNQNVHDEAQGVLHKARSSVLKGDDVATATFVGIHVRRGDLGSKTYQDVGYRLPAPSFFNKARNYLRDRYKNIVFIVASDDKRWSRENLAANDTFFSSAQSAVVDMAVLASCNHTITSVGTFSWWAAFLAGGESIYFKDFRKVGSSIIKKFNLSDRFPLDWVGMGD